MTVTEEFRAARDRCLTSARTTTRRAANSSGRALRSSTSPWTGSTRSPRTRPRRTSRPWSSSSRTARPRGAASRTCPARSDQVANWLRGQGVRRGDRMIIMLGNQVELWELDAGRHQAGHRHDPHHHPDGAGGPEGPGGARRRGLGRRRKRQYRQVRRGPGQLHADRNRRRRHAAAADDSTSRPAVRGLRRRAAKTSPRTRPPWPTRPCCSTSPRAPPPRPSSWSTRTPPTRWATCPPCSGSGWNPATCT